MSVATSGASSKNFQNLLNALRNKEPQSKPTPAFPPSRPIGSPTPSFPPSRPIGSPTPSFPPSSPIGGVPPKFGYTPGRPY